MKGNLSVTDALINRLVSDVLAEIDKTHSGEIIIQMNPKDISQLHDQVLKKEFSYVEFVENNDISNGNIKIIMGDTIIEDFIEKKLDELAAKLFNELPIENSLSNTSKEITERDNARLEEVTQSDVEIIDDDQHAEVSSNEDETIVEDPDESESSYDQ